MQYLKAKNLGIRFRGNQWTRGKSGGGAGGAGKSGNKKKKKLKLKRKKDIGEKDVREATKRLIAGEEVDMPNIAGAHTLIKKLAKVAVEAEKTGGKFVYDLCKVTVKGASAFCGGNKGIDRADMPQAKGEVVKGSKADKALQKQNAKRKEDGKEPKTEYDATKEFVAHMEKIGIKVSKPKAVDPASLKATQRNMQGEKVAGMMLAKDKSFLKEPIFVSRDGYIVDGHHRWAAVLGNDMKDGKLGNDMRKNVITLDAPISKILKEANKFTSEFGIQTQKSSREVVMADKKQIGIKDKLMLYITLGVLGFVALVIGGEYVVIMYSQFKTDEVVEAQPEVIALVQNALVGLIGIIGGYFGAKATKEDE
jgi:hypothetical protein